MKFAIEKLYELVETVCVKIKMLGKCIINATSFLLIVDGTIVL